MQCLYNVEMNKHILKLFTPSGRSISTILVFMQKTLMAIFQWGPPNLLLLVCVSFTIIGQPKDWRGLSGLNSSI